MMKVKKIREEFDFNNIPKIHQLVNNVAGMIIVDIKQSVAKGVDLNGSKFKALKPSTIRAKRKKGSSTPQKPLMDTHRMVGRGGAGGSQTGMDFTGGTGIYLKGATRGNNKANIRISADREDIARIHNEGEGDMPKREWFGVSKRAIKKLRTVVDQWIKINLYMIGK